MSQPSTPLDDTADSLFLPDVELQPTPPVRPQKELPAFQRSDDADLALSTGKVLNGFNHEVTFDSTSYSHFGSQDLSSISSSDLSSYNFGPKHTIYPDPGSQTPYLYPPEPQQVTSVVYPQNDSSHDQCSADIPSRTEGLYSD